MMQQEILAADGREHVPFGIGPETLWNRRHKGLVLQIWPVQCIEFDQSLQADGASDPVHILFVDWQIAGQDLENFIGNVCVHLWRTAEVNRRCLMASSTLSKRSSLSSS